MSESFFWPVEQLRESNPLPPEPYAPAPLRRKSRAYKCKLDPVRASIQERMHKMENGDSFSFTLLRRKAQMLLDWFHRRQAQAHIPEAEKKHLKLHCSNFVTCTITRVK